MNSLTLLVGVLLCTVGVYARHLEDVNDPDPLSPEHTEEVRKHGMDQNRHRRRRWQMNYGYDYPVPTHGYYQERRDYDRNQQDLLPQIVKLLEEISAYVKRPQPPPPPQPIYIPYPVPYPIPQYISCPDKGTQKPNVTSRFPEMEDTNQNWGFVTSNEDDSDDSNDGARPISFDPIKPIRPLKRPSPKVEHGSSQADNQQLSTEAPKIPSDQPTMRTSTMCNAAILSCCADEKPQQKLCFNGFGCGMSYDNGNACSPDSISAALDSFKSAYSPVQ